MHLLEVSTRAVAVQFLRVFGAKLAGLVLDAEEVAEFGQVRPRSRLRRSVFRKTGWAVYRVVLGRADKSHFTRLLMAVHARSLAVQLTQQLRRVGIRLLGLRRFSSTRPGGMRGELLGFWTLGLRRRARPHGQQQSACNDHECHQEKASSCLYAHLCASSLTFSFLPQRRGKDPTSLATSC